MQEFFLNPVEIKEFGAAHCTVTLIGQQEQTMDSPGGI